MFGHFSRICEDKPFYQQRHITLKQKKKKNSYDIKKNLGLFVYNRIVIIV